MFCDLHGIELEKLDENKSCVMYKKGQTLFYEGTRPLGLYCVKTGKVKVFKVGSQGKEQIMRLSNPGDFLGYRALLGEEYYAASAEVLEDASVCFIPKDDFLSVLQGNTEFYRTVVKALAKELGVVESKMTDLSQKSVRERLAGYLLMLKETYGMEGEGSSLIDLAISREDLANMVGTATETVIRLLSEFKKDGLINFEGKKIQVLDSKGLAKTADFFG
jgi:CRP/FNR family transcriptional regulator